MSYIIVDGFFDILFAILIATRNIACEWPVVTLTVVILGSLIWIGSREGSKS